MFFPCTTAALTASSASFNFTGSFTPAQSVLIRVSTELENSRIDFSIDWGVSFHFATVSSIAVFVLSAIAGDFKLLSTFLIIV